MQLAIFVTLFPLFCCFQDLLNRNATGQSLHWYKSLQEYFFRPKWELYDIQRLVHTAVVQITQARYHFTLALNHVIFFPGCNCLYVVSDPCWKLPVGATSVCCTIQNNHSNKVDVKVKLVVACHYWCMQTRVLYTLRLCTMALTVMLFVRDSL